MSTLTVIITNFDENRGKRKEIDEINIISCCFGGENVEKYDIFISYRRDGGAETAKHIRDSLVGKGYKVFFDLESLRAGPFNTKLLDVIRNVHDVLLILPPNGLDRCVNEDDWVRREVECALENGKNLIPVMLNGFEFPETLPEKMDPIRNLNGIAANVEFYDAFIQKLMSFLSCTAKKKNAKLIGATLLLIFLLLAGGILLLSNYRQTQEHLFGTVIGEKYINEKLGVSSYWDENVWTIQSRKEINKHLGFSDELMKATAEELTSSDSGYMDFMVISNDGSANLNMIVQTLDTLESAYVQTDINELLKMIETDLVQTLSEAYIYMGWKDIQTGRGEIIFNNKIYPTITLIAQQPDATMYQQMLLMSKDDYMYTFTATTFYTDYTQALLHRFLEIN